MFVTNQARLGIGTANPTAKLNVVEAANNEWIATLTGTGTSANYGVQVDCTAGYALSSIPFKVAPPSGLFLINGYGNVGIGTDAPDHIL